MAVNAQFADQVRRALNGKGRIAEKRMFGGLAFMLGGKMCCAVNGDDGRRLMVRVDPARYPALVKRKGARPMEFGGRSYQGYIWVEAAGTASPRALKAWVEESAGYVATLIAQEER